MWAAGAGAQAIPLLTLFPDCAAILVERNTRKAGFLQRVVGALGLARSQVLCGEFPGALNRVAGRVFTARAVIAQAKVLGRMSEAAAEDGSFLCRVGLGGVRVRTCSTWNKSSMPGRWRGCGGETWNSSSPGPPRQRQDRFHVEHAYSCSLSVTSPTSQACAPLLRKSAEHRHHRPLRGIFTTFRAQLPLDGLALPAFRGVQHDVRLTIRTVHLRSVPQTPRRPACPSRKQYASDPYPRRKTSPTPRRARRNASIRH